MGEKDHEFLQIASPVFRPQQSAIKVVQPVLPIDRIPNPMGCCSQREILRTVPQLESVQFGIMFKHGRRSQTFAGL